MIQKVIRLCLLTIVSWSLSGFNQPTSEKISIGDSYKNGEVKMKGVSGKEYSLNDLKQKKGLLVVFAANKCIAVKYWGDRLREAADYAMKNEIGVVWVNSNQTQREDGESLAEMVDFSETNNLNFPYVVDEDFLLANEFGVEVTPTSYLFDAEGSLIFQGLVDDNMLDANATNEPYLMNALKANVNSSKVAVPEKFGRGCRIPRE